MSSVSAPMARKLKSSMYERTVVGHSKRGERDGDWERDRRTVDE